MHNGTINGTNPSLTLLFTKLSIRNHLTFPESYSKSQFNLTYLHYNQYTNLISFYFKPNKYPLSLVLSKIPNLQYQFNTISTFLNNSKYPNLISRISSSLFYSSSISLIKTNSNSSNQSYKTIQY